MLRQVRAERAVHILQVHLALFTVAQNDNVRKIAAWAAIIAVPTKVCA